MPTTYTFPADAGGDGPIRKVGSGGSSASWTSIQAAGSGDTAYGSATVDWSAYSDAANPMIYRAYLPFDTSGLPDGATITAASIWVYSHYAPNTGGGGTTANRSVAIVASTQASPTALATSDWSQVGTTEYATRVPVTSFGAGAWVEIPLNAAGIAAISKTGWTKFAARMGFDLDNNFPSGSCAVGWRNTDYTGSTYDPYLSVTISSSFTAAGTDTLALSDTAATNRPSRTGADALSWTDRTNRPTPSARTGGTQRTVFAQGTVGTFGAHYAFPGVVRMADGRLLAVARKATAHNTYDGSIVAKTSSDDGVTWSSESTIIDGSVTGWDERDPYVVKLASGRLAFTHGRRATVGGQDNSGAPLFMYSDDNGATWSTPVTVAHGLYAGASGVYGEVYGSDIVELANGDLLLFGYGTINSSGDPYYQQTFCSKSTDGGATWSFLSYPSTYSGMTFGTGEPQVVRFETGKIMCLFRDLTDPGHFWTTYSTDGGATWSSPVQISGGTTNRQSISVLDDGRSAIISYAKGSGYQSYYYLESANYGTTWTSAVGIATVGSILWCMSTPLHGVGEQQNIGFIYDDEGGAQTHSSVYYKQFSGTDGVFVHLRSGTDAIAFTDTATRIPSYNRTGSDQLAWTDTSTRAALSFTRSGADTLTWGDTASGVRVTARNGTDTLTWTDSGDRAINVVLGVNSVNTTTFVRQIGKYLYLQEISQSDFLKGCTKTLSTVFAPIVTFLKEGAKNLSVTTSSVITSVRFGQKYLSLEEVGQPSFLKKMSKNSNATISNIVTIATSFVFLKTLFTTTPNITTLVRRINKPVNISTIKEVTITKNANKILNSAIAGSPTLGTALTNFEVFLTVVSKTTSSILGAAIVLIQNTSHRAFGKHGNIRGRGKMG